jgi:GntR family transcriptional regulator
VIDARHSRLADALRERILSGDFPPGSRLPGCRQLRRLTDVERQALRDAIAVLVAEGLVIASRNGPPAVRNN